MNILNEQNNSFKSIEERCDELFKDAFWICFEDNPSRIGWELHTNNSDVIITESQYIKPDKYYLIDVYLSHELINHLYDIVEGFTMWVDTYKSGRTSLHNILNYYTPENLEKYLEEAELHLKDIKTERENFVSRQRSSRSTSKHTVSR